MFDIWVFSLKKSFLEHFKFVKEWENKLKIVWIIPEKLFIEITLILSKWYKLWIIYRINIRKVALIKYFIYKKYILKDSATTYYSNG